MSTVGKVASCFNNWAKLTSDPWILQTVLGYKIELISSLVQGFLPVSPKW